MKIEKDGTLSLHLYDVEEGKDKDKVTGIDDFSSEAQIAFQLAVHGGTAVQFVLPGEPIAPFDKNGTLIRSLKTFGELKTKLKHCDKQEPIIFQLESDKGSIRRLDCLGVFGTAGGRMTVMRFKLKKED